MWFLLLLILLGGLFLHHVGLPEPVKVRVVAALRDRGWDVEFSRLRLRWYRGLVADHLHIQFAGTGDSPHLFAEEAEGLLNFRALQDLRLDVTALLLREGRLLLPATDTNGPRQTVCLNAIDGEVRFLPGDVWDLRSLRATCRGVKARLSGTVTNASALREWRLPRSARPPSEAERAWRRQVWTFFQQLRFQRPPEVVCNVSADVRATNSLQAHLRLLTADLDSPWGQSSNLVGLVRLVPPEGAASAYRVWCRLSAEAVRSRWGNAERIELQAQFEPPPTNVFPTNAEIALTIEEADTRWVQAARVSLTGTMVSTPGHPSPRFTQLKTAVERPRAGAERAQAVQGDLRLAHPATHWLPATVELELESRRPETRWGRADWGRSRLTGALPAVEELGLFRTNLLWRERVRNLPLDATVAVSNLATPKLALASLTTTGHWQSPRLLLEGEGALWGGRATTRAGWNTESHEVSFQVSSTCDPQQGRPFLGTNLQAALNECRLEAPPRIEVQGQCLLTVGTNRASNWISWIVPTLAVQGRVETGAGAIRGISFTTVSAPFAFSNDVWRLTDFRLTRPEGSLRVDLGGDRRTQVFQGHVRSLIDPQALQPLLGKPADRGLLEDFKLTVPPVIEGDFGGDWRQPSQTAFAARFAATNFIFRGQAIQDCTTELTLTNRFLSFLRPQVQRPGERGQAEGIGVDLVNEMLYLTNAWGNFNAYVVTRAIGSNTYKAIAPYVFEGSPTGRVWGVVDLPGKRHTDSLHIEVSGGPFRWRNFHLAQVAGQVEWVGETVTLTNVQGAFYGGRIAGDAHFDFAPSNHTFFAFNTHYTNVDLRQLMADVANKTNQLEGRLNGALVVQRADTEDPRSWFGHGHLGLTNGMIWDIPIFGIFSPILNSVVPGLGNSRAKKASATFILTNSVLFSRDLQIHATAMRMQYDLAVDFDQRIAGRVEAELLRDMPGLGLIISRVLWPVTKLFEYRLSGSIDQPKAEPLFFIPRILLLPFRPIKTLKELFTEPSAPPPGR